MRIAVLANLKTNAPKYEGMPADRWDDLDNPRSTDAIVGVLQRMGHESTFFEASIFPPFNLIDRLREYKPDMCFNLSESHFGDAREAQVPAILEMLQIPYTGSRMLGLALALDKAMTKRVLKTYGLPTAEFQLFEAADAPINPEFLNEDNELRYPLFVKPNAEGTSMGANADSIVRTVTELRTRVASHLARYNQPILVERFIAGREVMVGLVGNLPDVTFMPILELDHAAYGANHSGVYTNEMKTIASLDEYRYHCPAPLSEAQVRELEHLAAETFRAIDCKDVSRIDFRLDANDNDKPYILEINPLPGLNPGFSDLCLQALAAGWDHDRLVSAIVEAALLRHGLHETMRA
jgi:D-alanine-D-alanine ligase